MDKAERVALADAAIKAEQSGTPLILPLAAPAGDIPQPSASGEPVVDPVTPAPEGAGKPAEASGSEVTQAPVEDAAKDAVVFPEWVQKASRDALLGLSKEAREVVIADMDAKRVSLERDATAKWDEAAKVRTSAQKWDKLVNDPVVGPKVLEMLEAPAAVTADPKIAKLAEIFGEDAVAALVDLVDARADKRVGTVIHDRLDAPVEHKAHTNDAASAAAKKMGLTDVEFQAARAAVGNSLGWTPEDPDAPYKTLNPENVGTYLALAVNLIRSSSKAQTPAVSPPKPPVAKPASVPSNGMALESKYEPAWKRENREPRMGERYAETMRRRGLTEADVERLKGSM